MKKGTKQKKEKLMPMLGMMPNMFGKSKHRIVWNLDQTKWSQAILTKKVMQCGTCHLEIKPDKIGTIWNSQKDYLALAYLGFGDGLLGIKLVKFFGERRKPICLACLAENT